MPNSALVKFGPFLKILSYFGFFPIRITVCKDGKDVQLESISPCRLYMSWFFFSFCTFGLVGLSFLNIHLRLPEGYSFFDILIEIMNINPTNLDNFATWIPPAINFTLSFILVANTYKFGKSLIFLENIIKEHGPSGMETHSYFGLYCSKII